MEKYFLILEKRLVRGICPKNRHFLAHRAFEYINGSWVEINRSEINDRLLSYDFLEEDLRCEIREISLKEKNDFIKKSQSIDFRE